MSNSLHSRRAFARFSPSLQSALPLICLFLLAAFLSGCASAPKAVAWKTPEAEAANAGLCYQRVRDLEQLPRDVASPTDGFLSNQHCIALRACQQQTEFEDPLWLDRVMRDFIDPYTLRQGDWNKVMAACEQRAALNPLRGLLCQREMARYHIYTDLRDALAREGCSSAADWKRLEGYITSCIDEAGYVPPLPWYIKNRVISYRDEIRAQCLSRE